MYIYIYIYVYICIYIYIQTTCWTPVLFQTSSPNGSNKPPYCYTRCKGNSARKLVVFQLLFRFCTLTFPNPNLDAASFNSSCS